MFTPTTNLRLLSTPLENDYSNTLYFANVAAQTAYFTGKTVKVISDFNYIKKDNSIAINEHIASLYNCNYVMYQNLQINGFMHLLYEWNGLVIIVLAFIFLLM